MQILINGLISGSAIALLALAFQTVYLPTRVFFIALGGLYSAAPYFALAVEEAGGMALAVAVSIAGGVGLRFSANGQAMPGLARRGASDGAQLIASLGIYIVIVQLIAMVWGNDTKTLRMGLDATTEFGDDIVVTGAQWVTLVAAILSIGGFALFLLRSNLGLRLRALADNPIQFALFGYNMVIVGGLGTTAGPLVGAATLVGLPEVLRFLALPDAQAANLRLLIYGLLLVLMMHLRPQGIVGDYRMQ